MRRIYESSAIHRDDDDPFSPGEKQRAAEPQSFRSLPSRTLSELFVPQRLRDRAISVSIFSPDDEYDELTRVPFTVVLSNSMPFPITIVTESPLTWTWEVDGIEEASHVPLRDPNEDRGALRFSRGETKVLNRTWDQTFRLSDDEWERAEPGEYTIGVRVNVDNAEKRRLEDQTTIRIRRSDDGDITNRDVEKRSAQWID